MSLRDLIKLGGFNNPGCADAHWNSISDKKRKESPTTNSNRRKRSRSGSFVGVSMHIGDRVEARCQGSFHFYPGIINDVIRASDIPNPTYRVLFDDGTASMCQANAIRLLSAAASPQTNRLKRSKPKHSGSSSAGERLRGMIAPQAAVAARVLKAESDPKTEAVAIATSLVGAAKNKALPTTAAPTKCKQSPPSKGKNSPSRHGKKRWLMYEPEQENQNTSNALSVGKGVSKSPDTVADMSGVDTTTKLLRKPTIALGKETKCTVDKRLQMGFLCS